MTMLSLFRTRPLQAFVFPAWPLMAGIWVRHPWDSGQPDPEPGVSEDYRRQQQIGGLQRCLLMWDRRWFIFSPSFVFPSIHGWRGKPGFVLADVWHVDTKEKSEGNSFIKAVLPQGNLEKEGVIHESSVRLENSLKGKKPRLCNNSCRLKIKSVQNSLSNQYHLGCLKFNLFKNQTLIYTWFFMGTSTAICG